MTIARRLISNFASLSSVQLVNTLLPLVTVPYLVRVLGPDKFGLIAFAQALIGYFALITDYGFNLSATQNISIHRENRQILSQITSSILVIKFVLMCVCFIILYPLVLITPKFRPDFWLYMLTFGGVFGSVVFPLWFFQGMERMKLIALLNLLSRAFFTVAIFAFVRKPTDFLLVPAIGSCGSIISGLVGLALMRARFTIQFSWPSMPQLKHDLAEGWSIFLSSMATSIYTISNPFILGLFAGTVAVGYYSAAEKIIRAVLGIIWGPFSQTVFPHMSSLAANSKDEARRFIRSLTAGVTVLSVLISVSVFLSAPFVCKVLLGRQFGPSIAVLQILAPVFVLICLSNIFGIQIMLPFGYKRQFSIIIGSASMFSILLSLVLAATLKHIGIAISWASTECFVTVTMFIFLFVKEPALFKRSRG